MKAGRMAAALAVASGAAAQVSYTTVTYDVCPTSVVQSMVTITNGVTVTYCPECQGGTTPAPTGPGFTTVYTTTYMSVCPTNGIVPATYTITESCPGPTPTWSTDNHIPPGFTVGVTTCHVCGPTPTPVTVTVPCGCEATEGVPVPPSGPMPTGPAGSPPQGPGCPGPQCQKMGSGAPPPPAGPGGPPAAPTGPGCPGPQCQMPPAPTGPGCPGPQCQTPPGGNTPAPPPNMGPGCPGPQCARPGASGSGTMGGPKPAPSGSAPAGCPGAPNCPPATTGTAPATPSYTGAATIIGAASSFMVAAIAALAFGL